MIPALAIAASTLAILSDDEDEDIESLVQRAALTKDRDLLLRLVELAIDHRSLELLTFCRHYLEETGGDPLELISLRIEDRAEALPRGESVAYLENFMSWAFLDLDDARNIDQLTQEINCLAGLYDHFKSIHAYSAHGPVETSNRLLMWMFVNRKIDIPERHIKESTFRRVKWSFGGPPTGLIQTDRALERPGSRAAIRRAIDFVAKGGVVYRVGINDLTRADRELGKTNQGFRLKWREPVASSEDGLLVADKGSLFLFIGRDELRPVPMSYLEALMAESDDLQRRRAWQCRSIDIDYSGWSFVVSGSFVDAGGREYHMKEPLPEFQGPKYPIEELGPAAIAALGLPADFPVEFKTERPTSYEHRYTWRAKVPPVTRETE